MRIIVAVTGASGVIVGYRLIHWLANAGHEVFAMETRAARQVAAVEAPDVGCPRGVPLFAEDDLMAPMNSSSFLFDAVVVAPCSLKTLACIATGLASSLVARVADTALRTGRNLIVAPRETPLSASALENMLRLRRDGAIIAPLMVSFYHQPRSVEDMTAFCVGKLLDLLGLENDLYHRWQQPPPGRACAAGEIEV
jgi:flavin prenyltransferase